MERLKPKMDVLLPFLSIYILYYIYFQKAFEAFPVYPTHYFEYCSTKLKGNLKISSDLHEMLNKAVANTKVIWLVQSFKYFLSIFHH